VGRRELRERLREVATLAGAVQIAGREIGEIVDGVVAVDGVGGKVGGRYLIKAVVDAEFQGVGVGTSGGEVFRGLRNHRQPAVDHYNSRCFARPAAVKRTLRIVVEAVFPAPPDAIEARSPSFRMMRPPEASH
jgi:hypothetical protein